MLYIVSTPIGNLEDISPRAARILGEADVILCEDTRHSGRLLQHLEIKSKLISYHKFNEKEREHEVLQRLQRGETLALVSDAGTPAIADPGEALVRLCVDHEIPVTPIPGPCALIHALAGSGLSTTRFQFLSFLPKKGQERTTLLHDALRYSGSSIFYESPERITKTLKELASYAPERQAVVARELTKKFETFHRGSLASLHEEFSRQPSKGEMVLLIAGADAAEDWSQLSLGEHVDLLMKLLKVSKKEAMSLVAQDRGISRRDVYQALI